MKQVLHIFKKDAHEFWLEIVASLVIAAGLVILYPLQWSGPAETVWGADNNRIMGLLMINRGLGLLLVISWVVLMMRIVHAEGLVGDRQFWSTRPYEWTKLLAAKVLFIVTFILLPLVILQTLLLLRAGFNPLASAGGLAFDLLLIAGILLLPIFAIAAVTEDFTRMTLTLLGAVLGAGALVAIVTLHMSIAVQGPMIGRLMFLAIGDPFLPSRDKISTGHHSQLPIALLLLAVCSIAVVLQYARRRTGLSRLILIALPVALTLVVLITAHGSGPAKPFTDPVYAAIAPGTVPPVQLTYGVDEKHPLYVSRGENPVGVRIPLNVSGIAADSAVIAGAYPKVEITGADGFTWSQDKSEFYPEKFVPDSRQTHSGFLIPRAAYDRLKTGPVTVRITFALTQLQAANVIHLTMPAGDVMVPGYGICSSHDIYHGMLTCRSALREPQLTYASADWSQTPCPEDERELREVRGDTWMGMLDADPAEFGISPILFTSFAFMSDWNNTTGGRYLCSGSPITLTQYKLVGRMQTTLTIPNLTLPED